MITADDVRFSYGNGWVLKGMSVAATPGHVVGLIGPNGSGKTTLLKTLAGSLTPDGGVVRLDSTPVDALRPRELARRVSVVVQENASEIALTVAEMVLLGRTPHLSTFQRQRREDHRIAAAALQKVGARHLADRTFAGLSGGEKQRVLIARAVAQQSDHLLLDEPTNHLDIRYQHEVLQLVRSLQITSVVVLHDLNLAARYCDELVLLDAGAIVNAGPPDEVLTPEVLEPVYEIGVRRLVVDGAVQLLFQPAADRHDQVAGIG